MRNYNRLTDSEIEKVEKEAQKVLSISSNRNPFEIARKLGIKLSFCEFDNDLKGFISDGIIYINKKLDLYSQKIICSHEIGHFVLHNFEKDGEFFDPDSSEFMEFEANLFVLMLMPQVFSRFDLKECTIFDFNQYVGKQVRYTT